MSETVLRARLGRLEARLMKLESQYRRTASRNFLPSLGQVYRVVEPILPGERGSIVPMRYSFEQIGSPAADEGWVDITEDPIDNAANEAAALPILDSEYQTLAMPGAMIRAAYYKGELRTIGEYGITNVRVKATGIFAADAEGTYQIIDGGPQVYDGSAVTIKATLDHDVTTTDEFLFSYDRVAREWYEVKTGGGGNTWIIARAAVDVQNTDATFTADFVANITGATTSPGTGLTVHNLDFGAITGVLTDGSEYVFALKAGMKIICLKRDDGDWQCVQAGGVLDDYEWATSGPGSGGTGL